MHAPVSPSFLAVTGHRWAVPVLAHLHPDRTEAFGALAETLGASRDGLGSALVALTAPGWVARDEGRFGRYALTRPGRGVAAPCGPLVAVVGESGVGDVAFRKWTLPVVAALAGWTLGFAELRALLPDVTPRALALALKDMQDAGLVRRRVVGGFPPRTEYDLTPAGEALAGPVTALAARVG